MSHPEDLDTDYQLRQEIKRLNQQLDFQKKRADAFLKAINLVVDWKNPHDYIANLPKEYFTE